MIFRTSGEWTGMSAAGAPPIKCGDPVQPVPNRCQASGTARAEQVKAAPVAEVLEDRLEARYAHDCGRRTRYAFRQCRCGEGAMRRDQSIASVGLSVGRGRSFQHPRRASWPFWLLRFPLTESPPRQRRSASNRRVIPTLSSPGMYTREGRIDCDLAVGETAIFRTSRSDLPPQLPRSFWHWKSSVKIFSLTLDNNRS